LLRQEGATAGSGGEEARRQGTIKEPEHVSSSPHYQ